VSAAFCCRDDDSGSIGGSCWCLGRGSTHTKAANYCRSGHFVNSRNAYGAFRRARHQPRATLRWLREGARPRSSDEPMSWTGGHRSLKDDLSSAHSLRRAPSPSTRPSDLASNIHVRSSPRAARCMVHLKRHLKSESHAPVCISASQDRPNRSSRFAEFEHTMMGRRIPTRAPRFCV
jgi:hypothetical protein